MTNSGLFSFHKAGQIFGILLFVLLGHSSKILAQPFTEALRLNPVQRDFHYFGASEIAKRGFMQKTTSSDTIALPFFDDFSKADLSWAPSRFWFAYAIRDIHFINNSEARAFGDQGINLKTNNRGSSWTRNISPSSRNFQSVSFPEPTVAWACGSGGWLGISGDSGRTWTDVNSPAPAGMRLDKISFLTSQKGLVLDSAGSIYLTKDGGQTWSTPVLSPSTGFRARGLNFLNTNRVVLVGDSSRTAFSDDGGETFTVANNIFGRNRHFRNLKFADGFLGIAVGDSGLIFKTLNSGSSWFPVPLNSFETLLDVDINPANKKLAWAVGTNGSLFYSQTAGYSWSKISSGTTENLLSIALVNEFRGWIGTDGGRLFQVVYDPLRPYSRIWEPGSGVYINNTYSPNPITFGVATLDGLNSRGEPYSLIKNKTGPCDTLTSTHFDLRDYAGVPLFLSFYYQPGTGFIELIPDSDDSLALQFQGKAGGWQSIWNTKGKGDTVLISPFRYVSMQVADSLKFNGSRFRFVNFGNQNGNYDTWNLDYVRLDSEHDAVDSLAKDYAIAKAPGRLLKDFSALPLEQFQFALDNNLPIFNDTVTSIASNINTGAANLDGAFYVNRIVPDSVQRLKVLTGSPSPISGLENPFGFGIFQRPVHVRTEFFRSVLQTNRYASFEYGIGLNPDPAANGYLGNDSLLSSLNVSTVMAYDDGSAELVRGVGQNGSIGAVKFYLPVNDTITDIQLFFARTPENLQQSISFAILVYDSINVASNYAADPPLVRRQVILPPADSVNKFIIFSLRDDETLQKRILKGGRSFYVGWQQGLIDNGNEVRIGCDVNSSNTGKFFFKAGSEWMAWEKDAYPLMIRPVFGPEYVTSVKQKISKPEFPFFPNPSNNGFRNRKNFTDLRVTDMAGREVFQQESGKAGELLNPKLVSGIYFLHWMEDGLRPVVQKMLID